MSISSTAEDIEILLTHPGRTLSCAWKGEIRLVEQFVKSGGVLPVAARDVLKRRQQAYSASYRTDERKLCMTLTRLLGEERLFLPNSGSVWGAMAITDMALLSPEEQTHWKRLFAHAEDCDTARPTSLWRQEGKALVAKVGAEAFLTHVLRWFSAVAPPPPPGSYSEAWNSGVTRNISILRGLAWLCAESAHPDIVRALAKLSVNCLKKLPGIGPWAMRTANGAIWALSEMECSESIAQLGRLKITVASRAAINEIEKGLEAAAKRAGMPRADLEDLSIPAYGFDAAGRRRETFGDCQAVAGVTPTGEITVEWTSANGKGVKAPPVRVKKIYTAEWKAFKAEITSATSMLTAQKMRFEAFYLPERVWTLRQWRERFAEHPLLGNVARRLIWQFSDKMRQGEGIWSREGQDFVEVTEQSLSWLTEETEVRLWHPIGRAVEQVVAWRNYLQQHNIMQPFKQAYREVYLLTDAEQRTETYSNRFAAHLVKQHQMHALAALRGWHNRLRVMADDCCPPSTKLFPEHGLRAEFWTEGMGETYGTDTTESGAFLCLTTDQVRFYPLDSSENHAGGTDYKTIQGGQHVAAAAGIPLTEVPALVFSEVMRDVDLFVGVCSVGNDVAWQDGVPQGHYRNYWSEYAYGELTETARTRRDVLQRLLPRLKIAARCTLEDKFLIVRGDLRTYKIHLGSGNILMEPNDQYLCIVQDRSSDQNQSAVQFLPFEGDQRLALILSKALLLADDTGITDPAIVRQINMSPGG